MMTKKIDIKEMFRLWEKMTPLPDEAHLSQAALSAVANDQGRDVDFDHLALCAACRQRLRFFAPGTMSADDYVVPLAASAGVPDGIHLETANKKYSVEMYRITSKGESGWGLRVQVLEPFLLDGRKVVILDGSGRELLRGIIEEGEISATLEDVADPDLKAIHIKEIDE